MTTALSIEPGLGSSINQLSGAFRAIADPDASLRPLYGETGASSGGLDLDGEVALYHRLQTRLDLHIRALASIFGFHDVFFIDPDFNIIYSIDKEDDFTSNLLDGPYANSGLGIAARAARDGVPGKVYLSDFSGYDSMGGDISAFMVLQLLDNSGDLAGYLATQMDSTMLESVVKIEGELGQSSSAYLIGPDGQSRTPVPESDVEVAVETLPHFRAAAEGREDFYENAPLARGGTGLAKVVPLEAFGQSWGLVYERDNADALGKSRAILADILWAGAALAVVMAALGYFVSRSILQPFLRTKVSLEEVANGNLDAKVEGQDRGDEIGAFARSIVSLQRALAQGREAEARRAADAEDLKAVVSGLRAGLHNLSAGNLSCQINDAFSESYEGLRADFNQSVEHLANTISQVVEISESIHARAGEISGASEDLSRRTENQAAALEETAAALDEMTASVKSAAEGAREVEMIVQKARKDAEDSGSVVRDAVDAMNRIRESSDQISQIIGAIDDIAFQTNLLALNAGVEAARAGEAGKGFAVVASEVRALAQRSSNAAKEIKTLIVDSAEHVGTGVEQVGRAGEALTNIVGSVANITSLVGDIANGASEQSAGLAEINIGVTQLDQVTQQNAAMVEQATAASHSLQQDSRRLTEMVGHFSVASEIVDSHKVVDFRSRRETSEKEALVPVMEMQVAKSVAAAGQSAAPGIWEDF